VTLLDIVQARARIAPYIRRTPLVRSTWLSDTTGGLVHLKIESLQRTNSFKVRGAFNAVIARLARGLPSAAQLVTASAGNHGRALADAAETFRLPLVVFTPVDAPQAKLAAIRRHGADLRAIGRDYDHAEALAKAFARDTGAEFISPYSDPDVVAGAGTIALEIFEELPDVEVLVVPIGGAGLISGVGAAAKSVSASTRVVGVEVDASCAFQTSVRAGRLVEIAPGPTLADGLGGNPDPDTITFALVQRFVDEIVTVSEEHLRDAMVGLIEKEHAIAEGAGAASAAALLGDRIDVRDRRVVGIVTGSNVDRSTLERVLASSA
jgi:threonine dehydratase